MIAALLLCAPAWADPLNFGGFVFALPGHFTVLAPIPALLSNRFQDRSANTYLTVTGPVGSLTDVEAARQHLLDYGRTKLPQLGTDHGNVSYAFREERLPSGDTLFSIGTDGTPTNPGFALYFFEVSQTGKAMQLVFEGAGPASAHYDEYRASFDSAYWSDQAAA